MFYTLIRVDQFAVLELSVTSNKNLHETNFLIKNALCKALALLK